MTKWIDFWASQKESFKNQCLEERVKFLGALQNPEKAQKEVLLDILSICGSAKYGTLYNARGIDNIIQFQKKVPIKNYEQFKPFVDEEIEKKGGVFSPSRIFRWLKTSGSTGDSKKIPYTQYWMEKYRVPALRVLWANYFHYAPEMLDNPYAVLDLQSVREPTAEYLNGIPYQGITNRNYMLTANDWQPPWYEAPWFTEDVPDGYEKRMYYRFRYLIGQDLRAILSINPSTLIALRQNLDSAFHNLIKDIREGTLNERKLFAPDHKLASNLERIYEKDNYNFRDLWPNLNLIACWTSAAAKLYLSQLNILFPNAKILPFMTCGTEGVVTLPIDDHMVTGPLAINQGFYEFLPASVDLDKVLEDGKPIDALLFNELEEGSEYHLIMTQGNGMLRHSVGDIYKVTDFYNGVPRIEFSQRQGTYYSFTGEKLTEPQILSMIEKTSQDFNLNHGLFICCPVWDKQPYYRILLETEPVIEPNLLSNIQVNMDIFLRKINEEYDSKRKSDRLGCVSLSAIKKGTIERFQEHEKIQNNTLQYKYKPFKKDDSVFKEIMQLAETY